MTGILEHRYMTFFFNDHSILDGHETRNIMFKKTTDVEQGRQLRFMIEWDREQKSVLLHVSCRLNGVFYRCFLHLISVRSEQQSRNYAAIAAVLSFSVFFFSLLLLSAL
jgi:hypothetical protein